MEEILSACLPPACRTDRAGRADGQGRTGSGRTGSPGARVAAGDDEKKPGRVCAVCGGELGQGRKKYCSETCEKQGKKEYNARYYKEKWEKEREKRRCAVCGRALGPGRKKYCSAPCKEQGRKEYDAYYDREIRRPKKREGKLCVICGGALGQGRQKYCSETCAAQGLKEYFANYMRARRKKKERRCAFCGKVLGFKKIKYCDSNCREKAVKQRQGEKKCAVCGGELGYKRRKYCSEKCREIGRKKPGHKCPACGAVVKGRQHYCEKCAKERKSPEKQEKKERRCAVCGGALGYKQRKFCSEQCARKGKQEREKKWRARRNNPASPETSAQEEKTGKLCVICGKEVGRKKYKYCGKECAAIGKKRIDAEALGRRLRACEKCGAWTVTGKFSLCVACRTAEREKKKIKIGSSGHACRKCGAVIFVKRYYCESCREEKRAEEEKKKEGRCELCGEEVKRGRMCKACRERKRKEESLKLSIGDHIGKCPACGKEGAQIDKKEGLCVECALKKIRSYKKTVGQMRSDTLCWQCKNAVPKIKGGRYVAGCPWSVKRRPVPGWDAQKKKLDGGRTESFLVRACPGFVEG